MAECSDSAVVIFHHAPWFSKSLTSAARLILGFQGVLGIVAARIACTLPSGGVVCSGSSGVG